MSSQRQQYFRKRTFLRFFASLLIVTFLVLALSTFILYWQFETLTMEEQHRNSVELLSQARTVFSSIHSWLFPAFIQFSKESSIQRLMHAEERTLVETVAGLKLLNDAGGFYPLLHSIYIYNGEAAAIYSSVRGLEDLTDLSDPDFYRVLARYGEGQTSVYFPRRIRIAAEGANGHSDTTGENVFTVVIDDRPSDPGVATGGMVVNVSEELFRSQFLPAASASGGDLVIIDRAGTVLSHPDPVLFGTRLESEPYVQRILASPEREGTFVGHIDGAEYLVTFVSQKNMGWNFVVLTPYADVFAPIRRSRNIALMVFSGLTLLATLLAFAVSRRLYGPIHELFKQAQGVSVDATAGAQSEFAFVGHVLQSTVRRAAELDRNLRTQQTLTSRGAIRSILNEKVPPAERRSAVDLERYAFLSGSVVVAALRLDRFGTFQESASTKPVREILEATIGRCRRTCNASSLAVDMGDDHVAVVRALEKDGWDRLMKDLRDIQESVGARFGCTLSIGVSEPVQGLERLPEAYGLAFEASELRFRYGHGSITRWSEIPSEPTAPYRFPGETAQELLNQVRLGHLDEASRLLDQILDGVREYGHEDFRHLVEIMTYTIQRTLLRAEESAAQSFGEIRRFRTRIHQCETVSDLRLVLQQVFAEFCKRFNNYRSRKRLELVLNVKGYVEEHVSEPDLNVERVAEWVGLSTNYLRSLFRSVEETSLSSFISTSRLNECRRMLETTDLTVKEIHTRAGFVSYNYFFELFRREFGMTPVQYRATMCAGSEVPAQTVG
jgi:AraC-like DNA-binding protein